MTDTFAVQPLILYRDSHNRRVCKLYGSGLSDPEAIPEGTVLRFKLAENWADEPLLEVDSVAPTANASEIAIINYGSIDEENPDESEPAEASMLITMEDLEEIAAGNYRGLLGWTDPDDGDRWKVIELGEVQVKETLGGETGTT